MDPGPKHHLHFRADRATFVTTITMMPLQLQVGNWHVLPIAKHLKTMRIVCNNCSVNTKQLACKVAKRIMVAPIWIVCIDWFCNALTLKLWICPISRSEDHYQVHFCSQKRLWSPLSSLIRGHSLFAACLWQFSTQKDCSCFAAIRIVWLHPTQ
jgi:phage-related protein